MATILITTVLINVKNKHTWKLFSWIWVTSLQYQNSSSSFIEIFKRNNDTHYFHLLIFLSPLSVAMRLHLSFCWNLFHYGLQLNPHCQTEWTLFQSSSYKIVLVVLTPLIILSFFRLSSSAFWDLAHIYLNLLDAISCRLHSSALLSS